MQAAKGHHLLILVKPAKKVNNMGVFKKLAKSGLLGIAPQIATGGKPSGAMGGLASMLGIEAEQHKVHDKVKEIHHYHDKKKKK